VPSTTAQLGPQRHFRLLSSAVPAIFGMAVASVVLGRQQEEARHLGGAGLVLLISLAGVGAVVTLHPRPAQALNRTLSWSAQHIGLDHGELNHSSDHELDWFLEASSRARPQLRRNNDRSRKAPVFFVFADLKPAMWARRTDDVDSTVSFDPRSSWTRYCSTVRPKFLAIVSSNTLAATERLAQVARLVKPFWLAYAKSRSKAATSRRWRRDSAAWRPLWSSITWAAFRPSWASSTPDSRRLLALVREGNTWVKLSSAYAMSKRPYPYDDVAPFAKALIEAAPGRVVWGSNWPHPSYKGTPPVDATQLDLLAFWRPRRCASASSSIIRQSCTASRACKGKHFTCSTLSRKATITPLRA